MPAEFDVIMFQWISGEWAEITLTPSINQFIGFDGAKNLVAKAVGSATPTAHATTHAPNGSDPLPWASGIHGYGLDAAKPAAGAANAGYTYFSTDINGGTGYRSNGATWDVVTFGLTKAPTAHAATHLAGGTDSISWTAVLGYDTLANRPSAAASNSGYYYYATDSNGGTLYQSDGANWNQLTAGLTEIVLVTGDQEIAGIKTINSPIFGNTSRNITMNISAGIIDFQAAGADADIQVSVIAKGTGSINIQPDTGNIVLGNNATNADTILESNLSYARWDASAAQFIGDQSGSPATIIGWVVDNETVSNYTPTVGNTVSAGLLKYNETLYITPAGTLATMTAELPPAASARVGQTISWFISQIITALTVSVSGGGSTVGSAPNTSAVNSSFAYRCVSVSGAGTWIRIY